MHNRTDIFAFSDLDACSQAHQKLARHCESAAERGNLPWKIIQAGTKLAVRYESCGYPADDEFSEVESVIKQKATTSLSLVRIPVGAKTDYPGLN